MHTLVQLKDTDPWISDLAPLGASAETVVQSR